MNRGKQLVKNTFVISLGTIVPKLMATISLPIITASLSKAEYGTYDLVNILETLLLPFVTLQIQTAAFRFLIECRKDEERKETIVSTMICFVLMTLSVSLIILYFCVDYLEASTRLFICLYFLFNILTLTFQQIVRGLDHMAIYSISTVIQAVVNVSLIVFCVKYADMGLNGALIALCFAYAAAGIFLFIKDKIYKLFKITAFSRKTLKELINYSWPMIPNSLSMWVMGASDRLVLTIFLGIEANAVYAVANKIPSLFTVVQSTFTFAWQENASISSEDSDVDEYYSKVFDVVFCMMVGVLAMMIAATPILFELLIKGDYSEAFYQMPILFLGVFFSCMVAFYGGIYIAHKKTKSVGITTTIAAMINLCIDLALVNIIGIYAASISTLVSYLFLTIYRIIDIKKFQRMRYNWKKIFVSMFIIVLMCVCCYMQKTSLYIFNFVLAIIIAVVLNQKLIIGILTRFISRKKQAN